MCGAKGLRCSQCLTVLDQDGGGFESSHHSVKEAQHDVAERRGSVAVHKGNYPGDVVREEEQQQRQGSSVSGKSGRWGGDEAVKAVSGQAHEHSEPAHSCKPAGPGTPILSPVALEPANVLSMRRASSLLEILFNTALTES